ncbi:glycoside hydrolase family 16 protein [Flammeovirga pacifica]|uniref:GH16 domain-containing protein n=1 Tax=Flammeovirga pacifica TaxID=915059 RepID=A0A1S1YTV3_FLAPC|nr:glycoside hydrolase family 16 protein [Flammeovirga pacifica]OHX64449.1 hypothetical protein NH26_22960 [Flammeovirga pacifica]
MKNEFYFLTIFFLFMGCVKDNSQLQKKENEVKYQPYFLSSNQKQLDLGDAWIEVWSDEFNGTTLDTSKWTKTVSTKSRAPRPELGIKSWFWVEDHVWLNGNGQLILKGSKASNDKMFCGSVDSKGKYETKYGYLEARIKIADTSKGNHTAFWLQGQEQGNIDGTGNDGAEIDIFESAWTSDFTKAVVHIDGYAAAHKANTKKYDTPNIHEGYHIYGLLWEEDRMEIYYDGELKVSYEGIWVPQVKEWLWLSIGASFGDGDFVNQPIGDLSIAEVDYVRVWEKDPMYQSPNTTDNIRLRNRETDFYFRVKGEGDDVAIEQTNNSRTGSWTHWKLVEDFAPYYYIKNEGTQKFIRAQVDENNAQVYTKPLNNTGAWTQWEFIYVNEGYFLVKNKETKKYLRATSKSNDSPILLSTSTDYYAQWKIETIN